MNKVCQYKLKHRGRRGVQQILTYLPFLLLFQCPMACNRSERLMKLAERLHLYNPFDISSNTINTQSQNQEFVPKKQELGTDPIANNNSSNSIRSKSNRAAVLVCLFEDQQGHLRVILTKRASTLSTHSGN